MRNCAYKARTVEHIAEILRITLRTLEKELKSAGGLEEVLANPEGKSSPILDRVRLLAQISPQLSAIQALEKNSRLLLSSPNAVSSWAVSTLGQLPHEEMWLLCTDTQHRLIRPEMLAKGGPSKMVVEMAGLLRTALRLGARGCFLVHNHPGGDPTPSPEDIELTNEVKAGMTLVGIALLDHIIVARDKTVSFYERKLLTA